MRYVALVSVLLCSFMLWAQMKPKAQTPDANGPQISAARKSESLKLAPAVLTRLDRTRKLMGPQTKQRIAQIAPAFSARVRQLPPTSDFHGLAVAQLRSSFQGSNLSGLDIESLAMVLMAQASSDAGSDLRGLVDDLDRANRENRDKRAAVQRQKDAEMSEREALRLRILMDRKSKLEEALSNAERKAAQTRGALVQTLK